MLKFRINILVTNIILLCTLAGSARSENLTLWYNQPGVNNTQQGLMLGNGRLGGIVPGNPTNETIILNENSLWTGNTNPTGNDSTLGAYQLFGKLLLKLPTHGSYSNYRRELDLSEAAARVDYTSGGVNYHREIFCSAPDQVMVIRLTADQPNAYTGTLQLTDGHSATSRSITAGITNVGTLSNGEKYTTRVLVQNDGGSVLSASGTVGFTNCNALTIFVAMKTDYVFDFSALYHGADPTPVAQAQIAAAAAKSYATLWQAHTNDFQSIFNRVSLDLGPAPVTRTNLPTDQRLALVNSGDDVGLERLLFQYGRYLLISCSRPGGLPANLQGLWVDSNNNPWNSDYHANINVQMNYWGAEAANMSECHRPLLELIQSQLVPWRVVTAVAFNNTNGWALRTSHNINGGMSWNWNKSANAWYCLHFWEHFAYSRDTNYLQTVAYPIIKEICQFWQAELKEMPDGTLVAPNGWSPEHGPVEDGVTYDQELIWDLFNNYVEASTILGIDPDYRATISGLRDKLLKPRIGPWGELREWLYYPDNPTDIHRHTAHLFGLYPGRQISETITPELAEAARVSLAARLETGENRHPWVWAWRCALWAQLDDGDEAHRMINNLLSLNTFPNLIGNYLSSAVVQWDGNFGIVGGICEMLVQSQGGEIKLLPALPSAWSTGSVTGLRARGGFTVDMFWANGALTNAVIHGPAGASCVVRYGGQTNQLTMDAGGSAQFIPGTIPGGLTALAGNTQVSLKWNPSGGATNYIVKRATTSGGPYTSIGTNSTTTYVNTGLVNGTTYFYVVSALSAAGASGDSSPVSATPTPPPNAPTGLANQPLDGMAVVQWNAVPGATSCLVKWSTTPGGPYAIYGVAVGTTNYSVFGLTEGTTYYCVISAVSGEQESPNSVQLLVVSIGPPTGLVAIPGDAQVSLSWNVFAGATSYILKRSTANGGPYTSIITNGTTSYVNTGLANGTTYYYVVSALVVGGESADSSQASATPAGPPPPPAKYKSNGTGGGNWNVPASWKASTNGGSTWFPATSAPASTDETIEILNGDMVTISAGGLTIDQVTVASGGQLTLGTGVTTLANGTGTDLNIQGKLFIPASNTMGNTLTLAANASVVVGPNGVIQSEYGNTSDPVSYGAGATITNYGLFHMQKVLGAVSQCVWMTNSTLEIRPTADANGVYPVAASSMNQNFWNVTFDLTNQVNRAGAASGLDADLNVRGDLTIVSTYKSGGTPQVLVLALSTAGRTTTVGGNLYIKGTSWLALFGHINTANKFVLQGSLLADPDTLIEGSGYQNVSGKWNIIEFAGTGVLQFPTNLYQGTNVIRRYGQYGIDSSHGNYGGGGIAVDYQITGNYTLATPWQINFSETGTDTPDKLMVTGTLDCSDYGININTGLPDTGNPFTLAADGTLKIGSADGITSSGAAGTIQVTGNRNFATGANYVYNGAVAQVTGNGLPATVNNLAIANPAAAVALSQNETVSGALTVHTNAVLDFNGRTISAANAVLSGTLVMSVTKSSGSFSGSKLTQTTNTLAFGGAMTVTVAGEVLVLGDAIDLFDAPGFDTGSSFNSITCFSLQPGQTLSAANLPANGSITINPPGPTGPVSISYYVSGSALTLTWLAGQGWRLIRQTNGLSSNGWETVPGGVDGSNSIAINPVMTTVFYRLVYP